MDIKLGAKMKIDYQSASIEEYNHCKDCGWPIIFVCCNGPMYNFKNDMRDWWVYCSNKTCKNHEGEGMWQDRPDWFEKNNK